MGYPNSGFLVPRKAEGKQPTCTGTINIGEDLAHYINQQFKAGEEIILDLAGWTKESAKGSKYISVSIKKPYKKDGEKSKRAVAQDDEEIPF
jgi:hypothetical protein